jgi:HAD superfamily hydrolase (TIGR01509 family)
MRIMNRDTLIMLDLDGTIIDTSRLYFQGLPPVIGRHLNISIDRQDMLPFWGRPAKSILAHFARVAGNPNEDLIETMYAEFSTYYNANHNRFSTVYDGVDAALGVIGKAVHAQGVVTTRPRSRSAPVLAMPWARHMDFFIWGDQVKRNKPFPDGIDKAVEEHAVSGGACVYVGDNAHDIKAAKACRRRVVSVAALWGTMDADGLMAAKPDQSFIAFGDFADWVIQGGPARELTENA